MEHDDQRESIIYSLLKYPYSRLYFITIKDNSQQWDINKVNSWVRRYSNNYYIVKGKKNGDHFHLICGQEKNKKFVPTKSKHFYIKNLEKRSEIIYSDSEDERKLKWFRSERVKKLILDSSDSVSIKYDTHRKNALNVITLIKKMIEKYWKSKIKKSKENMIISKKTSKIESVLDYLEQNLLEDRVDKYGDILEQRFRYQDYITVINKKNI